MKYLQSNIQSALLALVLLYIAGCSSFCMSSNDGIRSGTEQSTSKRGFEIIEAQTEAPREHFIAGFYAAIVFTEQYPGALVFSNPRGSGEEPWHFAFDKGWHAGMVRDFSVLTLDEKHACELFINAVRSATEAANPPP